MTTILIAVLFLVFLVAVGLGMQLRILIGSRLKVPQSSVITPDMVTAEIKEALSGEATALLNLGFQFSHFESREELFAAIETPRTVMVFNHPNKGAYAEISGALTPDAAATVNVAFVTLFEDTRVMTLDVKEGVPFEVSGHLEFQLAKDNDVVRQWTDHIDFVAAQEKERDINDQPLKLSIFDYCRRHSADHVLYFQKMEARGFIVKEKQGYRVKLKAALRLLHRETTREKETEKNRLKRVQQVIKDGGGSPIALEMDAFSRHRQISESARFSTPIKFLLFLASTLYCSTLFGAVFSVSLVLMLVPVLVFHELGHLAAMSLFGYRDKQILVIPLGAMAIGSKKRVRTWQEIIVFLAGPLPGIILGLLMLTYIPDPSAEMYSLILLLLTLNCLNLLPFMPLDGGQIVNLLITSRFPLIQLSITVVSFLLFLCTALLIQDPLILGLVVLLGLHLQLRLNEYGLLRAIDFRTLYAQPENDRSHQIFSAMQKRKWLFNKKSQLAQLILARTERLPASLGSSAAGMMLYLLCLLGPVYYLISPNHLYIQQSLAENMFLVEMDETDYWNEQLEQTTDPNEKLDILLEAARYNDYENPAISKQYLTEATAIAHNITGSSDDIAKVLTAQITSAGMRNDIEQAESYFVSLDKLDGPDHESHLISALESMTYLVEDDASIYYLERLLTRYRQSGDRNMEAQTLEELAAVHYRIGNRETALALRLESTTLPQGADFWSTAMSHRYLARHYVAEYLYDEALDSYQQALNTFGAEPDESLLSELGWLSIFRGNLEAATNYFEEGRRIAQNQNEAFLDQAGFVGRLLLSVSVDDLNQKRPDQITPQLVIAYRKNQPTEARKYLQELSAIFIDAKSGSLDDYVEDYQTSGEDSHSYHGQIGREIVAAVNYARSTFDVANNSD